MSDSPPVNIADSTARALISALENSCNGSYRNKQSCSGSTLIVPDSGDPGSLPNQTALDALLTNETNLTLNNPWLNNNLDRMGEQCHTLTGRHLKKRRFTYACITHWQKPISAADVTAEGFFLPQQAILMSQSGRPLVRGAQNFLRLVAKRIAKRSTPALGLYFIFAFSSYRLKPWATRNNKPCERKRTHEPKATRPAR